MRVLIVNTSERTGGAAVAANRIMEALNNNGVKAKMLVRDKETEQITVASIGNHMLQQWRFLWERFVVFCHLHFSRKHLFDIDIANTGADITTTREFKEADLIHIHWINQGFLSLRSIRKILDSGKPVVWTMHDVWPATAICHLTMNCRRFVSRCQGCRLLPDNGGDNDLASKIWQRKKEIYDTHDISFVACSKWLASEAKKSALLTGHPVAAIPNPIDTHVFCPGDRQLAARASSLPADKRIILFVSQRTTNPYKGMDYLAEAVNKIGDKDIELVMLGSKETGIAERVRDTKVHAMGYISDPDIIRKAYSAADAFVLPSLSENLPNTIMEAMACQTPCVGFDVGGIPEMIDHKENGYVAQYRDADDLAEGLAYVLQNADALGARCREKVIREYSEDAVAEKYIKIYESCLEY